MTKREARSQVPQTNKLTAADIQKLIDGRKAEEQKMENLAKLMNKAGFNF